MVAVILALLVVVLVAVTVRAVRRAWVGAGANTGADAPARLLAWAALLLADDRSAWGRAMLGELDQLSGRAARWRFALGCLRVALFLPPRRGEPGRAIVTGVATGAAGCLGLVVYGLIRYPGLLSGARDWLAVAAFVATLIGYTVGAGLVVRRLTGSSHSAARVGLFGGPVIAVLWFLVFIAAAGLHSMFASVFFLIAFPVACLTVGAVGTWRGRDRRAGRQGALLAAVVAGLVAFLLWVGDTLVTAGRPYDAGMIRDFTASGAHDLATYAVSDNLGAGMVMLLTVPLLAAVLGCAGASVFSAPRAPGSFGPGQSSRRSRRLT